MNESSWNSVLAVIRGPLYKHSWKPAHRRNKDKHSCQPPATLFKHHHTFLLHDSSYIHAKWLADWWLPQRLLIPVCRFACQLWGLEAAHEKFRQYLPHGFIPLFDHKKDSCKSFSFNIPFLKFNWLILSCLHSAVFSSRENLKSHKLQMNPFYLHNSGDNWEDQ